jgi:hypothetical protein
MRLDELVAVPDAIEPVIAWRAWTVVPDDGGYRLQSVVFPVAWEPRHALRARCMRVERELIFAVWRNVPPHGGPSRGCDCGIYGAADLGRLARYLGFPFASPLVPRNRIVGTVALWGHVVECEQGWRAEYAYPCQLWVPSYGPGRERDLAMVLDDLAGYGVPVDFLNVAHPGKLLDELACVSPRMRAA